MTQPEVKYLVSFRDGLWWATRHRVDCGTYQRSKRSHHSDAIIVDRDGMQRTWAVAQRRDHSCMNRLKARRPRLPR